MTTRNPGRQSERKPERPDPDRPVPVVIREPVERYDEPPLGRTSCGAVFAGAVVAIAVMLVLQTAMLWLGLTAVDSLREANPFEGIGTAAAIGYAVAAALSLFIGGLVTGRLANRVNGTDVFLHGVLT